MANLDVVPKKKPIWPWLLLVLLLAALVIYFVTRNSNEVTNDATVPTTTDTTGATGAPAQPVQ